MSENLIHKESLMLRTYLENMREYCNKYDNIAILNQVRAIVGDENIALSDVYADFALVSKEEYDRGNGKKTFGVNSGELDNYLAHSAAETKESSDSNFDIDELVRKIDRKIYKLEVEEILDEEKYLLKKGYWYIYVIKNEDDFIECKLKANPDDIDDSIKRVIVKNDVGYFNQIKECWVWVRGYEISGVNERFFLLEPHWYKKEKELTKEEKDFGESKQIIEEDHKNTVESGEDFQNYIFEDDSSHGDEHPGYHKKDVNEISGMVILSEPGGGKTTYLKHLVYQLLSNNEGIYEKNGLDRNVSYIPYFVRTRDITNSLDNEDLNGETLLSDIMRIGIHSILSMSDGNSASEINNSIMHLFEHEAEYGKLLIIDGFEELADSQAQRLLDCIDYAYETKVMSNYKDKLIISSRYKEYGYQKLVEYCQRNRIEERYIIFDNKNNAIDICVSKWFEILKKAGEDNHEYFNRMRTSNSDIGRLITTPLELTGLIMLCQSQSALPTDITVLYRSIMEIWLTYGIQGTSIPFFSLSDIFLELATIAYYMAESENEKLRISRNKIIEIICQRRDDLRRYYRSNAYVNASSEEEINSLIEFWFRRNIFVKNSNEDIFEFAHREYQSYLISYAIVNNFIPKYERKAKGIEKRIDYFKNHMDNAEDFWDRVIIFSAFMSTDIHDDVIEYIFKRLEKFSGLEEKNEFTKKNIDKYYLSIILQLTNAEGFYFADYEYTQLFEELFKNSERISIMKKSVKGSEIKKMLLFGRKHNNTLFLNKCIETIECINRAMDDTKETDKNEFKRLEKERSKIVDILGNIVFYVAWNCDADADVIKKSLMLYLDNWITMDIIYEIKNSLETCHYNEERISLIREIGREAITREDEPLSDCYMLLSAICAYKREDETCNVSPYRVALQYFENADVYADKTQKLESVLIAINIVFLTTWFLQGNEARKCDCALKDNDGNWMEESLREFLKCVIIICDYMKSVKNTDIYSRDLLATYRDLCQLKYSDIRDKMTSFLYDQAIFLNCALLSENERITKKSDERELSYVLEALVQYPLHEDYLGMQQVRKVLSKRIEDIEKCMEIKNNPPEKDIYLLKLLIFAGKYDDNEKNELFQDFEIIKRKHPIVRNHSQLKEIEKYMKDTLSEEENAIFYIDDYQKLMRYMDNRIDAL